MVIAVIAVALCLALPCCAQPATISPTPLSGCGSRLSFPWLSPQCPARPWCPSSLPSGPQPLASRAAVVPQPSLRRRAHASRARRCHSREPPDSTILPHPLKVTSYLLGLFASASCNSQAHLLLGKSRLIYLNDLETPELCPPPGGLREGMRGQGSASRN